MERTVNEAETVDTPSPLIDYITRLESLGADFRPDAGRIADGGG
jgi:hypothetical protein